MKGWSWIPRSFADPENREDCFDRKERRCLEKFLKKSRSSIDLRRAQAFGKTSLRRLEKLPGKENRPDKNRSLKRVIACGPVERQAIICAGERSLKHMAARGPLSDIQQ